MKKMNIIRLICLSCFMYMASSAASAQDLKSILSGVANAVANKVTNSSGVSLEGTWKYTGPDCKFESDNFLYNPQIQISAESETKRSIFREKDKTKRSKKESAQHSKSRNKSFVMTSVSAL